MRMVGSPGLVDEAPVPAWDIPSPMFDPRR